MRLPSLLALLLLAGCAGNVAEQLLSPDESVRQAALRQLADAPARRRREVLPLLVARLSDDNGNVRRRAVQAVARMGPDAVNPLVKVLQVGAPRARAAAAQSLGLLGADAKSAAGALVQAEQDENDDVKMWAAVSLDRVKGTMSPKELELFRLMYGKKELAPASGSVELPADASPQDLLQALRRADGRQRERIVARLVAEGPAVQPVLMQALRDPVDAVRDGAAEALRRLMEKGEPR